MNINHKKRSSQFVLIYHKQLQRKLDDLCNSVANALSLMTYKVDTCSLVEGCTFFL